MGTAPKKRRKKRRNRGKRRSEAPTGRSNTEAAVSFDRGERHEEKRAKGRDRNYSNRKATSLYDGRGNNGEICEGQRGYKAGTLCNRHTHKNHLPSSWLRSGFSDNRERTRSSFCESLLFSCLSSLTVVASESSPWTSPSLEANARLPEAHLSHKPLCDRCGCSMAPEYENVCNIRTL